MASPDGEAVEGSDHKLTVQLEAGHSAGWLPEGTECCMDVCMHPLWRAALEASLRAPPEFVQEAVLEQLQLRCYSAGIELVTTKGDFIMQARREGLQGFGGGKYRHSITNKAHSARREAFGEANLDMGGKEVVFLSEPFLTTATCQHWEGQDFATCWLQIVVVNAAAVTTDDHGVVKIGSQTLWSREVASCKDCYRTNPSPETISKGTHWGGEPIFRIVSFAEAMMDGVMRRADACSLQLLREEILAAVRLERRPPKAYYAWEGSVCSEADRVAYEDLCERFLRHWQEYFPGVASAKWPLIATPLLYKTLTRPEWRSQMVECFRSYCYCNCYYHCYWYCYILLLLLLLLPQE